MKLIIEWNKAGKTMKYIYYKIQLLMYYSIVPPFLAILFIESHEDKMTKLECVATFHTSHFKNTSQNNEYKAAF